MTLRDLFNDRKWNAGDLEDLFVTVRHRGAPGDERVVHGSIITEITPNGLVLGDEVEEESQFLPYHRVLRVEGPAGVLWPPGEGG